MGRPREFDERQALEQAMQVFWAKGYEAASLCDLPLIEFCRGLGPRRGLEIGRSGNP